MEDLTKAIRIQAERTPFKEHSVPLYLTSSYRFDSAEEMADLFAGTIEGNIYSRYSNPNVTELIDKIAALEGAETGWATASGMAAVFTTFMALLESDNHIVASRAVFGSTHQLFQNIFPKYCITTTYVDIATEAEWEAAITPNTKILYVETPSNPGMDIADLTFLGNLARKHQLLLVVDNCFASPYLQNPIRFGADLVIHSTTKYIDGQGRTLGGIIVGQKYWIDKIEAFARHSGPALSPFNAWLLSKSVETLPLRMERHSQNALALAQYLSEHPQIETVKYPFLPSFPQYDLARQQMKMGGGIVSFYIKGGITEGRTFINGLSMCSISANLGDTRSIVTHPASSTHAKLSPEERLLVGISDNLIRISVGLEHITDIIADIDTALSQI